MVKLNFTAENMMKMFAASGDPVFSDQLHFQEACLKVAEAETTSIHYTADPNFCGNAAEDHHRR